MVISPDIGNHATEKEPLLETTLERLLQTIGGLTVKLEIKDEQISRLLAENQALLAEKDALAAKLMETPSAATAGMVKAAKAANEEK